MCQTPHPSLAIIIPTLNEAATLPGLLDDLRGQKEISCEIIVGDGGSTDATQALVEAYGAGFVRAERGRGKQMNVAARDATSEYLLFLHADSRISDPSLLSNGLRAIRLAALENSRVAGHFSLHFLRATKKNELAYRYLEEKTALNRVNTTNGDQGLLLSREFFRQLGGFDERLPFLEDQAIAEKIRSQGKWVTLPGTLTTSARRFESEGFHRRYLLMGMMMGLYSVGAHSFFLRAPEVYRAQQDAGRLLLSPFFRCIREMIRSEWGLAGTIGIIYRLGRYIRQNFWQPFFFLDVCCRPLLGAGKYPCLKLHDRVIAPCTRFRIVDALAGMVCFLWYLGVLAPFFWLREWKERSDLRQKRQPHAPTG